MAVLCFPRYESAKPLPRLQQTFLTKNIDRLPNRDAGNFEFLFKLFQRGDFFSRRPLSGLNPGSQHGCDLNIQGHPASIVGL